MKRKVIATLAATAMAIGLTAGVSAAANRAEAAAPNASGDPAIVEVNQKAPTWEEFKASVYKDSRGVYVVDGDLPVLGDEALKKFYDAAVSQAPAGSLKDGHEHGEHADLAIALDQWGQPAYWNWETVSNLTYCVSNDFGSSKQAVIDALETGSQAWENASSAIDFKYAAAEDANCNTRNWNVVFSVEPSDTQEFTAAAFFPDFPKEYRSMLVTPRAFEDTVGVENILSHELGHVLGFRHEHTRSYESGCFEDWNWEPLTPYDSSSIMHYPECNGTGNLTFTYWDGEGTRYVYGW